MPRSISLTTGLLIAAGVVLLAAIAFSIISGHGSFFSMEGLVIVVGGSVANAYLSFQREDVNRAFRAIRNMVQPWEGARSQMGADIKQLLKWSYIIQKRDVMGLEQDCAKEKLAPLMRYGVDLVVSGYGAEKVREMMQTVAEAEFERHTTPIAALRNMAATAPSFGMVGTLVGMVLILKDVGTDLSSIGGGLAIAMLSTLYGILVARLVCLPAADKQLQKEEAERMRCYMLAEGFGMLAEKQNPFYMLDRLNSFMEPSQHFNLSSYKQMAQKKRIAIAA